ncbi:phospho-N-acetylmuramoyl-pentapeptide-transferase [Thermosipho ferrireducens]|uniref:Phospho-N-acetylmuramoyl-pentapeptide-transferase n=1 Tax=Thermosipho ferrireducens TaxID=2571116 RepID=A0ABX7S4W3_9BACT|nr:phospho-N-acetylmuramoyl-pentapeptide-transferase [Thermosipho ferrireducens]QTA37139.1 phospho-N-acetylmuramoyl-pentapeptide-transferase [Thermosipho ferrireducens]
MEAYFIGLSFVLAAILYPLFIRMLKIKNIGQYIREEGPDLHNYKTGTPTAGGILFILISVLFGVILKVPLVFLLSLSLFGLIGFMDDVASIYKKDALGLKAWQKFLLQIIFAFGLVSLESTKPIFGVEVSRTLYNIFWIFVIVGASNAVNLTDGLDGLAGWVFITAILPFGFLKQDIFAIIVAAAVLSFLLYNTRPASIFMGDTGSLALGAFLATFAMHYNAEDALVFTSTIFIVETLSVIIQVSSFKLFNKRLFKMSPIHHHFELLGWKEEKIVGIFAGINLLIALTFIVYKMW